MSKEKLHCQNGCDWPDCTLQGCVDKSPTPETKVYVDNWPEDKNEQINWFLVNILRLLDSDQVRILTKNLVERT